MINTIFFDKDGTLLKFDPFWVSVSRYAIGDILKKYSLNEDIERNIEELLLLFGVNNDKTDIDSVLCKGTYAQMAEITKDFLAKKGLDVDFETLSTDVTNSFNKNIDKGEVVPTCENIREVLAELKERGINLCVVTTDNKEITHECLKKLNIIDMFEYIYTDDGEFAVKPSPDSIDNYCALTGASKDKIVMVGDTETDIRFAKNAGISVICVGDDENLKRFEKDVNATASNISKIFDIVEVM